MKPILTLLALTIATCVHAQTWSLVFSNSLDGWKGPVAVSEISADGKSILKTIPLDYSQFLLDERKSIMNRVVTNMLWVSTNWITLTNVVVTNSFWPQTNWFTNRQEIYFDTNAIKKIITDGQVCTVNGHLWQPGCGMAGCLVNHGDEPMRHCLVCKKWETRELGPWK